MPSMASTVGTILSLFLGVVIVEAIFSDSFQTECLISRADFGGH